MPPHRERYNAKARSSGGTHSHKRKRVSGSSGGAAAAEAKAMAEVEAAQAEKLANMTESQRRAHDLMQELVAQNTERGGAAMSTKKRKRFEAFVAKQMKKEEHSALLESLAESSKDVGDRSQLVSSSTLGTGKVRTAAARLQDEKDRKANLKLAHGAPRQGGVYHSVADDLDADLDELKSNDTTGPRVAGVASVSKATDAVPILAPADRPNGEQLEDPDRRARIEAATRAYAQVAQTEDRSPQPILVTAPAAKPVGSALAGAPVVRKPKRKPPRKRVKRAQPEPESDFDSSASSSSETDEASPATQLTSVPASASTEPFSAEGKGKAAMSEAAGKGSDADGPGSDTDEEMDEEDDAAIVAELKRRGLNPKDYGFGDDQAAPSAAVDKHPSSNKGKWKAVRFEPGSDEDEAQPPSAEEEYGSQTDDEMDEEQDAAILAELLRRGMNPKQFGYDFPSDDDADISLAAAPEASTSKGKSTTKTHGPEAVHYDHDEEVGSETDDEMNEEQDAAIAAELARRGMNPKQFGFDWPSDDDAPKDPKRKQVDGKQETPTTNQQDQERSRSASPLWEGFASEHEVQMSDSGASDSSPESSEEDENEDDQEEPRSKPKRSSGFKAWAQQALAATGTGRPEDAAQEDDAPTEEGRPLDPVMGLKVRVGDTMPLDGRVHGPLGEAEGSEHKLSPFAKAHYEESKRYPSNLALVERSEIEQEARLKLPVVADEDNIVQTILENPVTVLCGETGSGKTTQVPQFLYERGFGTPGSQNPGMIGITQPRRVAAVSMANRVQVELGVTHGKRVGYQVRYEGKSSDATALKFMTDGVLLRELATDFLLSRYSVVVIDEAHERSVNTDILIGLLTRIVRLREKQWLAATKQGKAKAGSVPSPLRLIIMSATLRVNDFVSNPALFPTRVGPPPVLEVQGRQHEVNVHFNKRTCHDYIGEAVKKVSKIHTRLPPGAILVFLTGQQEIVTVVRQLQAKFSRQALEHRRMARAHAAERAKFARQRFEAGQDNGQEDEQVNMQDTNDLGLTELEGDDVQLGDTANAPVPTNEEEEAAAQVPEDPEALDTDDEMDEGDDVQIKMDPSEETETPLHVLPLYSLLPPEQQMRVFQPPPEGERLVVVATNVAETSLTIPGVRYVVDCGRAKERTYDPATGVQGYKVNWISKASASQRSGRAGRTGPGHCYRLYSSTVFEDHFDLFSPPEIQRTPVEAVVLHMKAMGITKIRNFPFPSPPPDESLERAERQLVLLGALDRGAQTQVGQPAQTTISASGRAMAALPLAPRLAKMVVEGYSHSSLPHVLAIVSAITVGDPFVRPEGLYGQADDDEKEKPEEVEGDVSELKSEKAKQRQARQALRARYSEAMQALNRAYGAGTSDLMRLLVAVGAYEDEGGSSTFCQEYFLRPKAMEEIHKLRAQLGRIVLQHFAPDGEVDRLPDRVVRDVLSPSLSKATLAQVTTLRKLVAQAFADQIAVRADQVPDSVPEELGPAPKAGKTQQARRVAYRAMGITEYVFLHPSSDLARNPVPKWIVFTEAVRGANKMRVVDEETQVVEGRTLLRGLTKIEPEWLVSLAPRLITWDRAPAESAPPDQATLARALAAARNAPAGQEPKPVLRSISRTPRYAAGPEWAQGLGWPLPAVKVPQKLVNGRWVDAE